MKKIFIITPIIFLICNHFLFNGYTGFHELNITQILPAQNRWNLEEPYSVKEWLSQPYHYLAQGKQSFAFESADKKYVIKFLKTRRVKEKHWYGYWQNWIKFSTPLPVIKYFIRKSELFKLCDRFALAFRELQDETALLYVHLNQTAHLNDLVVTDDLGKSHHLDLNKIPFVIQKKVVLAPERIRELLDKQDLEGARLAISSLRDLLLARIEKGYTDAFQVFNKNYGFIGAKAIQLDIGKIHPLDPATKEQETARVLSNLNTWLQHHFPTL